MPFLGEFVFPDLPFPIPDFNEVMAEHYKAVEEHARMMSEAFSGINNENLDGDLALAMSLSEEGNYGSSDRITSPPRRRQRLAFSDINDEDYALALSLSEEGNSSPPRGRQRQRSRSRDRDAGGSRNSRRGGGGRGSRGVGGDRGGRSRDSRGNSGGRGGATAGASDPNAGVRWG